MTTDQKTTGRRVLTGKVVSSKMDKTVTVKVTSRVKHPRIRKYVSRSKNYKAHDEANECSVDDVVTIQESRPLSKQKRWVVLERVSK